MLPCHPIALELSFFLSPRHRMLLSIACATASSTGPVRVGTNCRARSKARVLLMSFSMERRRPGTPRRDAIRGRGEVTGEPRLLEPRKMWCARERGVPSHEALKLAVRNCGHTKKVICWPMAFRIPPCLLSREPTSKSGFFQ